MTKNFVITGGAGFLGKWLTKFILEKYTDSRVRVIDLMNDKEKLPSYMRNDRVDLTLGKDICSFDGMRNVMEGADALFHLAGYISFWRKEREKLERTNVDGTRRTLEAALDAKVPRVVHVSSVAALGYDGRENVAIDEDFEFDWDLAEKKEKWYMLTKHQADLVVDELVRDQGLDCVVGYPGLMWGPQGEQNSLGFIKSIAKGGMPFNMPGGTNVVDVRDVARGLINIYEKGKCGEGYLLSGYNLAFKKINRDIARILKVNPPRLDLPRELCPILYPLVYAFESLSRKKPALTTDNVHSAARFRYFDNQKALREIGWQPNLTFEQTVRDTVDWAKEEGHL